MINELPKANRDNITFLFRFFARLVEEECYNKMSVDNIIVVLSPNLLWNEAGVHIPIDSVYKSMIEQANLIFDDVDEFDLLTAGRPLWVARSAEGRTPIQPRIRAQTGSSLLDVPEKRDTVRRKELRDRRSHHTIQSSWDLDQYQPVNQTCVLPHQATNKIHIISLLNKSKVKEFFRPQEFVTLIPFVSTDLCGTAK